MTTKEKALHTFFSSFGMMAYEENSVPQSATYPYITYSMQTDGFGGSCNLTMNIFTRGKSWATANEKSDAVYYAIGAGGKNIHCDDGIIWIRRGSPFSQSMGDPNDDLVKRKYINITAEFLTI